MTDPLHEPPTQAGAATSDREVEPLGDRNLPVPGRDTDTFVVPGGEESADAAAFDGRPDQAPAGLDALIAAVQRLEAQVSTENEKVLQAFSEKLSFDVFKEAQIERLHAELQLHRDGLLERATRPLLHAVIRMHDDVGKAAAALRTRPPEEVTPEGVHRLVDGFREDLELLLAQHGVEPFDPPGDVFDPRVHTASRTVATSDPALAGHIAERLRPGFSQGEALLQKARVAVFTAQTAPSPAAPLPAPTTTGEEG